ncbi:MAG: hypothetical protein ACR2RA_21695 [Geminicoccaceae bacterium]
MKTELDWPETQAVQGLRLSDHLAVEPATSRAIATDQPIDSVMAREAFQHLLAFEQRDGDRRLSAAAAFFLFLFGVGCGAIWMMVFSWLL